MSLIKQMNDAVSKACEASLPDISVGEALIFSRVLSRAYKNMPQLRAVGTNQQFFSGTQENLNGDLLRARILLPEEIRKSLAFIYPGSFLAEQESSEESPAMAVLG